VAALFSLMATDPAPGPYLLGMLAGFLLGGLGHLYHSRLAIASGITLIAVTTALFILATDPHLGSS
jgi:hypothetical protein